MHVRDSVRAYASTDDQAFQISVAYPRGGDKIGLRAATAKECHIWMKVMENACLACRDAERRLHNRQSSRT